MKRQYRRSRRTLLYPLQQHLYSASHYRLSFPRLLRQHLEVTHFLLPVVPQGFLTLRFYASGVLSPLLLLFLLPLVFLLGLEEGGALLLQLAVRTREQIDRR